MMRLGKTAFISSAFMAHGQVTPTRQNNLMQTTCPNLLSASYLAFSHEPSVCVYEPLLDGACSNYYLYYSNAPSLLESNVIIVAEQHSEKQQLQKCLKKIYQTALKKDQHTTALLEAALAGLVVDGFKKLGIHNNRHFTARGWATPFYAEDAMRRVEGSLRFLFKVVIAEDIRNYRTRYNDNVITKKIRRDLRNIDKTINLLREKELFQKLTPTEKTFAIEKLKKIDVKMPGKIEKIDNLTVFYWLTAYKIVCNDILALKADPETHYSYEAILNFDHRIIPRAQSYIDIQYGFLHDCVLNHIQKPTCLKQKNIDEFDYEELQRSITLIDTIVKYTDTKNLLVVVAGAAHIVGKTLCTSTDPKKHLRWGIVEPFIKQNLTLGYSVSVLLTKNQILDRNHAEIEEEQLENNRAHYEAMGYKI